VLILTYNITLRNYIHDKISQVREDFAWNNFLIIHYHEFFKSMANNLGLPITSLIDFNREDFFEPASSQTPRFAAIFVDEVQDYRVEWLRGLRRYFLQEEGEFVLFGDEKQNIYGRDLEADRRIQTNIRGRWNELTTTFRLSERIVRVATAYQNHFLKRRYDLDAIEIAPEQLSLFDATQHFEYFDMSGAGDVVAEVFDLYRSLCERYGIHPNDVCIVSSRIPFLRELDYLIRTAARERTMTMFESKEAYNELCKSISHHEELDDAVEGLRKAKKFHFWMNPGTVKLATIHSFKGWEISTLILVLFADQATVRQNGEMEAREAIADEELVYTAITRCRHNLFVANFGNRKYHEFFSRAGNYEKRG
jgi:superfamily I DNA/RNA helicase